MNELVPRTQAERNRPPGPVVWVCTYDHDDVFDIWVCRDEDTAYHRLAEACRESWEEAFEVEAVFPDEGDPPFPAEAPADDRAAVELYFAAMNDADPGEWFGIARFEVLGARGGL